MNRPLLQRLLASVSRPPAVKTLAVAVSGGCDSVALLLLLYHWSRMRGVNLCVFHVDHDLRHDSSADALWVKDLAERLNLNFFSRRPAPVSDTEFKKGSEAWARRFRYSAFADMMAESGAEAVATGHTANDQTETILMRLLRGCSWKGLCGIGSRVKLRFNGRELQMWRPLLRVSRATLIEFLESAGQDWREDFTNASDVYFRNRVRHRLLPMLEELQPGACRHFSELGDDARLLWAEISGRALRYIRKYSSGTGLKVYITPKCTLRREIVRLWLASIGTIERADRQMIIAIDDLWRQNAPGNTLVYRDFSILRTSDSIIFVRGQNKKYAKAKRNNVEMADPRSSRCSLSVGESVRFGGWLFALSEANSVPDIEEQLFAIPVEYSGHLSIRYRKPGDRFYPAGGRGGKKLARWLIDKKVPVSARDHIPLLVAGDRVLLVCGLGRSRYLVDNVGQSEYLWLRLKRSLEVTVAPES